MDRGLGGVCELDDTNNSVSFFFLLPTGRLYGFVHWFDRIVDQPELIGMISLSFLSDATQHASVAQPRRSPSIRFFGAPNYQILSFLKKPRDKKLVKHGKCYA